MTIENFRGIEFVRISSMPKDEQEKIWSSFEHEKIIKIVKDQSLMNDCILYPDFEAWKTRQTADQQKTASPQRRSVGQILGKLAFE